MEIFHIEPETADLLCDMTDEDICSFAELQKDPTSDAENELFIYTCFLIFTRKGSLEYLERAIQGAEGWVAVTSDDHPDRARRVEIHLTVSATMCEHSNMEDFQSYPDNQEVRLVKDYQRTVAVSDLEDIRKVDQAIDAASAERVANGSVTNTQQKREHVFCESEPVGLFQLYPNRTGSTRLQNTTAEYVMGPDIVAVHGLNGSILDTWTHLNGKCWLKDFLPLQIPGSRIFYYEYPSEIAFSHATSRISYWARRLIRELLHNRRTQDYQLRPIIFVCHSMGGFIVKKALIISHEDYATYQNIIDRTFGILFMGSPHRSSESACFGRILNNIAEIAILGSGRVGCSMKTDIMEALDAESSVLEEMTTSFCICSRHMRIVTLYEGQRMDPRNDVIVSRTSAALGLPNEEVNCLFANHQDMCCFETASDNNYKVVSTALLKLSQDATYEIVRYNAEPHSSMDDLQTVASVNNLAVTMAYKLNFGDAETLHYQALNVLRWLFGSAYCTTLQTMDHLALVLEARYKYSEAEGVYEEVLTARLQTIGEMDLDTAMSYFNMASISYAQQLYPKAVDFYRKSLQTQIKMLGEAHSATIMTQHNLASALLQIEEYDEAAKLLKETTQKWTSILGLRETVTLMSMANLAMAFFKLGNKAAALRYSRRVLEIIQENPRPGTMTDLRYIPALATEVYRSASVHEEMGRGLDKVIGPEHARSIFAKIRDATSLERYQKHDEAGILFQLAFVRLAERLGAYHSSTIRCRDHIARSLLLHHHQASRNQGKVLPIPVLVGGGQSSAGGPITYSRLSYSSPTGQPLRAATTYSPLSYNRPEIRLITILPAGVGEPLRCKLRTVNLDKYVYYEALSYAWGDKTLCKPIVVNGETINITASLDAALRRLRYRGKSRTIWADALCINQTNIDERNHQIQLMKRIFSGAEHVLIWLGAEQTESSFIMDWFIAMAAGKMPDWNTGQRISQGLSTVLGRSWWSRIWVVHTRTCSSQTGSRNYMWRKIDVLVNIYGWS